MIGSELTSAVGFGSELAVTLTKPAKRPNLEREGLVGERTCIFNFDAVSATRRGNAGDLRRRECRRASLRAGTIGTFCPPFYSCRPAARQGRVISLHVDPPCTWTVGRLQSELSRTGMADGGSHRRQIPDERDCSGPGRVKWRPGGLRCNLRKATPEGGAR